MAVNTVRSVDRAISVLALEVTLLIVSVHEDAEQFTKDLFSHGERGEGGTLLRLAFAGQGDGDGLVVETDSRFTMRLTPESFGKWRERDSVRGARVVMREPEPPPERAWERKG